MAELILYFLYFVGLKASLGRLQLEYVDVVFANRPDPNTPMEGNHTCCDAVKFCLSVCSPRMVCLDFLFFFANCATFYMQHGFKTPPPSSKSPLIYAPYINTL